VGWVGVVGVVCGLVVVWGGDGGCLCVCGGGWLSVVGVVVGWGCGLCGGCGVGGGVWWWGGWGLRWWWGWFGGVGVWLGVGVGGW
jgi:hypothetical protein